MRKYDQLLLDLDGCLWVGDEAVPGAADAVAALREAGKAVAFLTNDVRHAPEDFVRKLWRLGFQAALDEVVTVGAAVQYLLSGRGGGARTWSARRRSSTTSPRPHADRQSHRVRHARRRRGGRGHEELVFEELKIATQAVLRGAELIGTGRDRTYPMPDGPWPGTGAVLAAIETATGRPATVVVGKPEAPMYEAARDRLGDGRCLGVGDRLDSDIAGARRAGMDSALVLTGAHLARRGRRRGAAPHHVGESLGTLVLGG
jgi:ribonucleotide monophosphatase NagD (HAD superfamily)